jgi:riboflavin kinase/FMN adenylyltransferase
VASIGVRPTLDRSPCVLEAHLFGADEEMYGEVVEIRFRNFLRDEQRFESLEALSAQMQRDGVQARAWLKNTLARSPRGRT